MAGVHETPKPSSRTVSLAGYYRCGGPSEALLDTTGILVRWPHGSRCIAEAYRG
jgi:hypothetical protein